VLKCGLDWRCMAGDRRNLASRSRGNPERFRILLYDIPARIYEGLTAAQNVFGIYFCSPWLSEIGIPGFVNLLQVKGRNKAFEVLTRPPPKDAPWHLQMMNILSEECKAKIYCNPVLHAKLYIVMAESGAFAVFGSPNLTKTARSNIEVAIITYDKSFIDSLFNIFQIHLKTLCKGWRLEYGRTET